MSNPFLVSIQVGQPAQHGPDRLSKRGWFSGIFKTPVSGPLWLGRLNLDGDGQADPSAHGGPFRAVLAYHAGHYPAWRETLSMPELPYGAFGENFTVTDLTEETVCIGDVYEVGSTLLQVSQPRRPCWKLARRWGIKDLAAQVERNGRGGWYHRVLREGQLEAGLPLIRLERPFPTLTIQYVNNLMSGTVEDQAALSLLANCEALTPEWRAVFAGRLSDTRQA